MSQAPSMPLFTDAYLADTMHLSLEEHGAYLKILMVTWRNNGTPLADDDRLIARILGIPPRRWRDRIKPAVIGFFDLSDGTLRQKRLEKEWSYVASRAATARANGAKRSRRRAGATGDGEACEDPDGPRSPGRNCREVLARCRAALGVTDERPGFAAPDEVAGWLAAGCDPDLDILPTLTAVQARRRKSGHADPPAGWRYFTAAVTAAMRRRQAREGQQGEASDEREPTRPRADGVNGAKHRAVPDDAGDRRRRGTAGGLARYLDRQRPGAPGHGGGSSHGN